MNDLISVIIPVYNRQDVIEECINSVFAQSYQNFEIVIVDDGSTDNTIKICEVLTEKDPRIKLFLSEHGGVSTARNKAIEESNGEYIFFLDSDDVIHPQLLETLLLGIKNSDALISGTGIVNVSEKNWDKVKDTITKDISKGETTYHSHTETLHALFTYTSPINLIGGVMMKRELIGDTRFNKELFIGEDYYFIYENLIKGTSSIFLKQKWYYCRLHRNNASNNFSFEAFWTRFYRRVLVWKSEEAFGRADYANIQKGDAVGVFSRCINANHYYGEAVKKMCNVMKQYKYELLPALKFTNKVIFLFSIYIPYTHAIFNKLIMLVKKFQIT